MALAGKYAISLKTRLADVVHCPASQWKSPHGWKLSQKHLDFVLYDPQTTQVIAVVELDDCSHERPERQARDRFVNDILQKLDIAILRVKASRSYCRHELRGSLERAIA
jgi:hypothetical protein